MKSVVFLSAALLVSAAAYCQNESKEQIVVPLSDPAKPGTLKVELINGSIKVIGYTGKDVVIEAVAGASTRKSKPEESNGMKRISTDNSLDLSAEEKNNQVKVESGTVFRTVNLTIKVPQKFSLTLSTVNNGNISVENVSGEHTVTNVNGTIQLTGISGSAVANTVNGNLTAQFNTITAGTPMAFSTLNGNVDVTFPATLKATVNLKSDRGEIFTDFDVAIQRKPVKTERTAKDGMYRVKLEDSVSGTVNGGGAEILLKNMHGNIFLRKGK
ncbi:DUF4097 family beta strand repeat-containing protein [Siphonobacter aquaeclarae]|jgi:DUF4097 and DUF4098 domain-containing protein YvlB|uniref:Adhesin n=1 Tax=Siphonobacter aquaeclarae TaxID=563176 RepID=A0A1G9PL90_9BACT|nr:DUF4097 family beta strand repeat-containing protein [Siphonobacter aquaeclarae]MBO9638820.1 hypothetical protein [Siphonobacter aquaeclarae]SDL99479.1 hypothetical protein SAMN04488090_2225 [Siphonobacter aquaeclarae]